MISKNRLISIDPQPKKVVVVVGVLVLAAHKSLTLKFRRKKLDQ